MDQEYTNPDAPENTAQPASEPEAAPVSVPPEPTPSPAAEAEPEITFAEKTDAPTPKPGRRLFHTWAGKTTLIAAAIIAVLFLLLLLQGGDSAQLRFLWAGWYISVSAVLLIGFIAGVTLTLLLLAALRLGKLTISYSDKQGDD